MTKRHDGSGTALHAEREGVAAAMNKPKIAPRVPDASDVVTGPVGDAALRDPASAGPEGADLDQLPIVTTADADPGAPPDAARSNASGS